MIRKAIIPAAGLGTRLLPATKEQPKEMLPIFAHDAKGQLRLKPFLQMVFEELHDYGCREFCFIVGRGKRSIEDHFTTDNGFTSFLKEKNKSELAAELDQFYRKVGTSTLVFINQPEPRGFGNAVYCAKPFTGKEPFLVHAGDDLIFSKNNSYLKKLVELFEESNADAVFFVEKVKNPSKFGVIVGKEVSNRIYEVERIVEKPQFPPSNIAAIAIYAFKPKIFQAIEKTAPDENNEIQLTDAIQRLIDEKCSVYAMELSRGEKRIDVGTPRSYLEALRAVLLS